MSRTKTGTTVALVLASLLLTPALGQPARAEEGGTQAGAKPYVIVVAAPSTGHEAARGRAIADGADDAVVALNASGGLNGRKFVLQRRDDGCSAPTAEALAAVLVTEKPDLVLGHPCPRSAIAAADAYGKGGVLFIATTTRHPLLTSKRAGPTVFRLSGRDDRQGSAAGAMLARDFKDQAIAIVQDRTQYARAILDGAVAALKLAGAKSPVTAAIVGGDMEYKATVAKTKDAAAVLFAGFPIEAGFVHAALRQAGSTARFIGSDSLATDEFVTTFGTGAVGIRVLAVPALDMASGPFTALSEQRRAKAAVEIFAAAVRQTDMRDSGKIAEAISAQEFATGIGAVRFSKNGDAAIPAFAILEWDGGRWNTVGETPP